VKKLIKTLKDNLLIIVLLSFGGYSLLEKVIDSQLATILVMIWSGFLLTLCIWGIVDTIRFAMKNKKD
jgi:hypothetical protein